MAPRTSASHLAQGLTVRHCPSRFPSSMRRRYSRAFQTNTAFAAHALENKTQHQSCFVYCQQIHVRSGHPKSSCNALLFPKANPCAASMTTLTLCSSKILFTCPSQNARKPTCLQPEVVDHLFAILRSLPCGGLAGLGKHGFRDPFGFLFAFLLFGLGLF